ncbi:hypothetical protein BT96DRAFT_976456 [Gymnopus androsaceus JB14]|uniref:guanosine-diphosphatase n=1 Tax=Gymnopus androsaceus JB14 TaxID=1447944 RepID=A0A6A4HNF5_9AGAR|nr:hypothetical protein BT96DRAFT_976456 [Gymnopus androsaceus JB14]
MQSLKSIKLAGESTDDLENNKEMVISPQSNVEGEMGPSRMETQKQVGWKILAFSAGVIIGLLWFFGPHVPTNVLSWLSNTNEAERIVYTTPHPEVIDPVVIPSIPKSPPLPPPASFGKDPDPSKTTHCTAPYAAHLPLVQYALMIDAGLFVSRIHIYKFNNCGSSPSYEYEVSMQRQLGLYQFAFTGKPRDAAESLDVLLDRAVAVVPSSLRSCTPVAVKATAAARFLPQIKATLDAITIRINGKYPFKLHEPDGVVIMDGKDEGVYAWITANYLLNTIRADTPANTPTYAVLDLGGASTRIVFEPTFSTPDSAMEEGEHKYELEFGGRKHVLYQHSYLGYGLTEARAHVHSLVDSMASLRNPGAGAVGTAPAAIGNPCLARGTKLNVDIRDKHTRKTVVMDGEQIGSFDACNHIVELVMAKDSICELKPCSFNGVYQPSLFDTFASGKVLLLSYFFDRLRPLLFGIGPDITVSTIASLAKDVCLGRDAWVTRWGNRKAVMNHLEEQPEWCLDLTFMHSLLRLGYEFSDEQDIVTGKTIQGAELGWYLGAAIAMLGGGELKCRVIA